MIRATITLVLTPEPRVDLVPALRGLLKDARRRGLRCIAVRCDPPLFEQSTEARVATELVHAE
jgi:hypothetical protein